MKHYALVGMRHRGTATLVSSLPEHEDIELRREPENRFDPFAVQVWTRGQHVGYIAANQVRPLAQFLDARQRKSPLAGQNVRLPARLHWSRSRVPLVEVMEMM